MVDAALGVLQAGPERPWTVGSLAREVRVTRATPARRFTALVGEPPMRFLLRLRLDRAADVIADGRTLAAVAGQVGYGTPFALSAAFSASGV